MHYKPKQIRIVHGDNKAKEILKRELKKMYDVEVIIPGTA